MLCIHVLYVLCLAFHARPITCVSCTVFHLSFPILCSIRVVYFGTSSANLTDGVLNVSRRSHLFGFEIALDLTFSSTKIGFPLMEFWTPRAIDLTFHGIHMKERSVRTPQDATKKRVGNVQNKTCRSSCRLSSSGRPGASTQHGF